MQKTHICGLALIAIAAIGLLSSSFSPGDSQAAANNAPAAQAAAAPKPVETDMHEFMEYIYKPTYLRLRTALAKRPRRTAWRNIKADVLVQAEGGNLLLIRAPKENAAEWNKLAVENRELGAKLYAAAKKRDYTNGRKHWEAMIKNCNVCHTKFAGGEHQLKP